MSPRAGAPVPALDGLQASVLAPAAALAIGVIGAILQPRAERDFAQDVPENGIGSRASDNIELALRRIRLLLWFGNGKVMSFPPIDEVHGGGTGNR